MRGIHRVFEIDAYRGIGLRELEGFRGKGIYALSRDSGIVFTYQPPFAKARYPSGEIVDSFPAWPPPGYRDAALNAATNQLLVWTEAPDDNRLWLYSLDSYQLIDTIPIPRPLRYGTTNWQPGEHRLAYESMSWSTDARYMALGLLERWSDRDQRGYPVPREAYQTWVLGHPQPTRPPQSRRWLVGGIETIPRDHRFYVTTAGMSWLIFDTDFNHLRIHQLPSSRLRHLPRRQVCGGDRAVQVIPAFGRLKAVNSCIGTSGVVRRMCGILPSGAVHQNSLGRLDCGLAQCRAQQRGGADTTIPVLRPNPLRTELR